MTKKTRRVVIALAIALAVAVAALIGAWISTEIAWDRCLDAGGAWTSGTGQCVGASR